MPLGLSTTWAPKTRLLVEDAPWTFSRTRPWPAVGGIASLAVSTTTAICQEAEIEIVVRAFVADEIESSRRLLESAFDPSWAHLGEALG